MTSWLIRRGAELVAVPWRNGLGTTRDVVSVLAPDGALRWQVSIAELVQDAPFSHYPHCDRVFTPIAGDPPPALAFAGGSFEPCPLLVPKRFAGDIPTRSRIPARGRAFNAIVDRRHHAVTVTVVTLDPGMPLPGAPDVAYCHAGALALDGAPIMPGDALLRTAGGSPGQPVAHRPSLLIVVCIAAA